jgi:hypothetical protein
MLWNLNNRPLEESVARLARRHRVDVLALLECNVSIRRFLEMLNHGSADYFAPWSECARVRLFTRFGAAFASPVYEEDRLTVREIRLPARPKFTIFVAHLPSKLHQNEYGQTHVATRLAQRVQLIESQVQHERSILFGDLNMNPFEPGVAGVNGLHAVMTPEVAARRARTVQGQNYPFFFNPMWALFGNAGPDPPGTYYSSSGRALEFFWHTFDQVLLRPDVLPYFRQGGLRILKDDGQASLVSESGIPDRSTASDHLPLIFQLEL